MVATPIFWPSRLFSCDSVATAQQIKSLVRSFTAGDDEHFVTVALQIAAHSAKKGDSRFAQELRELVDEAKQRQSRDRQSNPVPIARPTGDLAGLLVTSFPKTRLSNMVLPKETSIPLTRVVHEYRHQDKLRGHGLSARRKLLLVGPPGCGKTMTASALAGELHLPLFAVQLHGLITKLMGETSAKLHLLFQAMHTTRGVYFFDEFDAIGGDRGATNDVGEARRILNSFLQFLEQDDSDSLILAATNHANMLDDALFRRFDEVVRYARPTKTETESLIRNRLHAFLPPRVNWKNVQASADGLSHAEIARACDNAAKQCVIEDADRVTSAQLVAFLNERQKARSTTE